MQDQTDAKITMIDISRRAADLWNDMSAAARRPYVELAQRLKEEHQRAHPDYKFAPRKKRPRVADSQRRDHESSPEEDSLAMPTLCSPFAPPAQLHIPERTERSASPYTRSDRPGACAQFDLPDSGFTPQEFLSHHYNTSTPSSPPPPQPQTHPSLEPPHYDPQQQHQDFEAYCEWNHDFSRSGPMKPAHSSYYRPQY